VSPQYGTCLTPPLLKSKICRLILDFVDKLAAPLFLELIQFSYLHRHFPPTISVLFYDLTTFSSGKGKGHPITGHQGPRGE
jgi:hypothetical protein